MIKMLGIVFANVGKSVRKTVFKGFVDYILESSEDTSGQLVSGSFFS